MSRLQIWVHACLRWGMYCTAHLCLTIKLTHRVFQEVEPEAVMHFLSQLYQRYDRLAEELGIYKASLHCCKSIYPAALVQASNAHTARELTLPALPLLCSLRLSVCGCLTGREGTCACSLHMQPFKRLLSVLSHLQPSP